MFSILDPLKITLPAALFPWTKKYIVIQQEITDFHYFKCQYIAMEGCAECSVTICIQEIRLQFLLHMQYIIALHTFLPKNIYVSWNKSDYLRCAE